MDQVRRETSQKRGAGQVRGDSIVCLNADHPAGFEQFMAAEPTPEFLILMEEQQARLFAGLRDDTQRTVAQMRLEGYSNEEIASDLGISLRSVERKLKLIRETWSDELE